MKTWITTDTHLFHRSMFEKGYRPKDSQTAIIKNWQRMVNPLDTVIHLGDVICGEYSRLGHVMAALPGTKILVRGNHDMGRSATWYKRNGFDFVCDSMVMDGILFTHEPTTRLPDHSEIDGMDGWRINVHGHLHSDGHRDAEYALHPHHYLIALEHTNYKPVSLDYLKKHPAYCNPHWLCWEEAKPLHATAL